MNPRHLLILPRYTPKGPSSRVRFYQYLTFLREAGFSCDVRPFFDDGYIDALFTRKPVDQASVLGAYFHRIADALQAGRYDLVWLQYELLPWLPNGLERLLMEKKTPLVVDYDDAVFHRYGMHRNPAVRALLGGKIAAMMCSAQMVVAGNAYIADYAKKAGARQVAVLPSVVDTRLFNPVEKRKENTAITIGWIGSPVTIRFLEGIAAELRQVLEGDVRLVVVGAEIPAGIANLPVVKLPWSLDSEVAAIQQFDVGIMPLPDEPFERGKCGYKLIQYMACGVPAVASPVGVNATIIEDGVNGFLASDSEDWVRALRKLIADRKLRQKMGTRAREKAVKEYSLQEAAKALVRLFEDLLENPGRK